MMRLVSGGRAHAGIDLHDNIHLFCKACQLHVIELFQSIPLCRTANCVNCEFVMTSIFVPEGEIT